MAKKIEVLSREVRLTGVNDQDYVCLTDIARYKETIQTDDLIRSWLRNRNTLEFLGLWEQINNPGFNPVEFDGFRKQAGLNSFTLTPKQWTERKTLGWDIRRNLAKINYCIHTDAIQMHFIPPELSKAQTTIRTSDPAQPDRYSAVEIAHSG